MANIKKKFLFSNRKFLNLSGSYDTGSLQAEIYQEEGYSNYPGDMNYTLKFTDCNKMTSFNFCGETDSDKENSRFKINTMIEVLTDFKSGLEKAFVQEDINFKIEKELKEKEEKESKKDGDKTVS